MSTSSGGLRTTTYETAFGRGRIIWNNGLLTAHELPVPGIETAGISHGMEIVSRIASLLEQYFNGRAVDFEPEKVHLDRSGWSPFEADTAAALWKVPYGTQTTYARLAALAGHPGAHRAVGNFMAKNPFPVLLPCHRVVRSDGEPGGYSEGLGWKKKLAEIEGSLPAEVLIK